MEHQSRKILMAALFAVFIFLRLFSDSSSVVVGGDYIKYLLMAKNFPYHTTANNQMEINHGPFFPYLVYSFTMIFQEDYMAAIIISLLSAVITFYIIYRLSMMLTNNFFITFIVLIFFTLSVEFITTSQIGTKESFVLMIIISSIYFYIKGIKFRDKQSIIAASIFGGITALTVDHTIFLFPTFFFAYIFFNYKKIDLKRLVFPGLKYAALPVLVTLVFYASWTGLKAYQYSTNEYYPAGADGDPVSTEGFGIMELLNPRYFEGYDPTLTAKYTPRIRDYAYGLGYMFDIVPFDIPRGINFSNFDRLLHPKHVVYMLLLYAPLALMALFFVLWILKNFARNRKIYNNAPLFIILIFLIFLFPLTQTKSSLRYFYTSFIFLYFFLGYGILLVYNKLDLGKKLSRFSGNLIIVITILLLLLIPYWYISHGNLILLNGKYVTTPKTAEFIRSNINPDLGIMMQTGYNYQLQYQIGSRIVGIPPNRETLLRMIDYYDIDFILFGNFISGYYHYSEDSINYIKNNPEKFTLLATISEEENQELRVHADEISIFKVLKPEEKAKKDH